MIDTADISIRLIQEKPVNLDVNIDCFNNETLALVGPSGSGKSTVLRSIAGIHKQVQGHVHVKGQYWLNSEQQIDLKPQQRSVGILFQEYALFPHKTALENIMLSLPEAPKEKQKQDAKIYLNRVHLSGLEERHPHQLSGGQKQRVALARALARNPDILLLDEPFSSLDQFTRQKLIREISRLKKDLGIPIIMVTHDLDEARIMADRICIIHHGNTLQQAKTNDILTKPINREVAHLLGMNNVFNAEIIKQLPDVNKTIINWQGNMLECRYYPIFEIGDQVDWVIPAENIIIHRRDRPSHGERENPIAAVISESLSFGENTHIITRTDQEQQFSLTLPSHVAKRNHLFEKEKIRFSLLANAIHLMPQC